MNGTTTVSAAPSRLSKIEGLNELNQIISEEKGFDAKTITQADIDTYGLG